ncbi:MAG: hypothetical protein AAF549_06310 [Pseudomonadota bacterium]
MIKSLAAISVLFLCTACASGTALDYLRIKDIPAPQGNSLTHCFGYGCEKQKTVKLSPTAQKEVAALFKGIETADNERDAIAQAIAVFEEDLGEQVGTKADRRGTFRIYEASDKDYDSRFQQDCVDESTNTTSYLIYLEQNNLLRFHRAGFPVGRQPFLSGDRWWHQSASVFDLADNQQYVVDSWFHDNGHKAEIAPLDVWMKGWSPHKAKKETKNNEAL